MTIARDEDEVQICCDHCPASFAPYDVGAFRPMIAEAKGAGWRIRQVTAARARGADTSDLFGKPPRIARPQSGARPGAEDFTHTCPACAAATRGSLI